MAKTVGTTLMSRAEDLVALGLVHSGLSNRKVGELLGRSDKSIALATERAKAGDYESKTKISKRELQKLLKALRVDGLSEKDGEQLKNVAAFQEWLDAGMAAGYFSALVALLR